MKKAHITNYKNAHYWKKENKYILTGYRKNHNTIQKILTSLKTQHNELLNVYTHLIPSILLITHTIFFIINKILFFQEEISLNFTFPLIFSYLVSIFCLSASSIYHLFSCKDFKTCCTLIKYDHCGILGLIYFHFVTSFYYMFYYSTFLICFYTGIISCGGFFMLFVIFAKKYQDEKFKFFRTFSFIFFICTNIFPICHVLINSYLANDQNNFIDYFEAFYFVGFEFLFYIIGVFFYLSNYPEKIFPKKFDIWCNSHVIWHVFVALAIYMQFKASNIFYDLRKEQVLEFMSLE